MSIKVKFSKQLPLFDKYCISKDACIKKLEEENAQLKQCVTNMEKRIEELERLLGMNSKNSLMPPSFDPPGMSVELPKQRRKKRGARNGHQPHLKELLSQEFVKQHIHLKPNVCTCGSTNLQDTDQKPLRHQVVDIPPIKPEAVEYVQLVCGDKASLNICSLRAAVIWPERLRKRLQTIYFFKEIRTWKRQGC